MKLLGLFGAALVAVILVVFVAGGFRSSSAQAEQAGAPTRPLLFVPGLLGSRLCRPAADGTETVVWGTSDAMGQFPTLEFVGETDIVPCGLIREISFLGVYTQQVYGPFIDRLHAAGYVDGKTLFVFDYDWRLSVLDNAKRLAGFVEAELPAGKFDIVGHSMGGLIARTYAVDDADDRIGRLITAGSPWRGSVQVFELLHDGWGLANGLLGGLDAFRRTVISFPSTFELMPSYDGCCTGEGGFAAGTQAAWAGLDWPGIDATELPDLAEVAKRQATLRQAFDTPLPAGIEDAMVIGVDQRTPEQFALVPTGGEAQLNVRTSWDGDGTVLRDSAVLSDRIVYPTSFATHDAILSDVPVQDFVLAALRLGPKAAAATVPVKPRDEIRTALGRAMELIGVAVTTDQPAYRTGARAKLIVHLRLATVGAVDLSRLEATVTLPGSTPTRIELNADAGASDPTNPFEQSYSATLATGELPGELTSTVTLETASGTPRVATHTVPVVPR